MSPYLLNVTPVTSPSRSNMCNTISKKMPKTYWGEAVLTTNYLILPSKVLENKAPITILFGGISFVHIHSQRHDELDPQDLKYIFLSYSSIHK